MPPRAAPSSQPRRRPPAWALAIGVLGGAGACGYAPLRTEAPFGARRIAVVPFLEDVPAGIAAELARAVAERLAAGGAALASDGAGADAVLSGRVLDVATVPAPVSTSTTVPLYRVSLRVLARLTRADKELWRSQIEVSDDYLPAGRGGAYTLATEANRREALRRLTLLAAARVAHDLGVGAAAAPSAGR